jgi:hypothetical protein
MPDLYYLQMCRGQKLLEDSFLDLGLDEVER